jgi:hypothetical protein
MLMIMFFLHLDIKFALLNGILKKDVYFVQPLGFVTPLAKNPKCVNFVIFFTNFTNLHLCETNTLIFICMRSVL